MTETEDIPQNKTLRQKLWNIAKLILKVVVTGALLYYVFSKVPLKDVKNRLVHANYWWMFAAVICFALSTLASSWRLLSFFKSIHLKLHPILNLRLYLLGMFYNFLLPGGIGGDGYKIYILNKRYKLPAKKMFWAILFDRLSGLWAIGLLTVMFKLFMPQIEISFWIPFSVFAVGSVIYYFVLHKFFNEYTHRFFEAHGKAVLVQSLQVLTIILVLAGQDYHGKYTPYLLSFLLSALAAVLPTIGGAGAREAMFKLLSGVFHTNLGLAIFLSVSFYLISLLIALFGAYYVARPAKLEEHMPAIEEE